MTLALRLCLTVMLVGILAILVIVASSNKSGFSIDHTKYQVIEYI